MSTQMVKNPQQPVAEDVDQRPTVAPAVDVYENADEFLLVADVPGVPRDAVSIHIDDGRLTLTARRGDGSGDYVSAEYRAVDFKRTFALPDGLDFARSAAELKDGVLTVHVPKSAQAKPRRIEVKSA